MFFGVYWMEKAVKIASTVSGAWAVCSKVCNDCLWQVAANDIHNSASSNEIAGLTSLETSLVRCQSWCYIS